MNRNVKILATSLVALNMVVMPAYAVTTTTAVPVSGTATNVTVTTGQAGVGVQIYTVEQAADLAVKQSFELKTSDVDRAKMGRQIDDTINNINSMVFSDHLTATDKKDSTDPLVDNLTLLRNNVSSTDESNSLKRATLKDTIKSLFISINKAELQLKAQNAQIALDEKLIEASRVKVKMGLMSKYDLESSYNDNLKNIRSRDALVISIDKLYGNLKSFIGVDAKTAIKLDYSFLSQTSIILPDYDGGLVKMNGSNMKVTAYFSDLKRAKEYRVGVKDKYGSSGSSADLDQDKAQLTYDNAVKNLPYAYETAYNDVKEAYQSYFQKQRELDVKKLDLKNGEVKLKLGRLSQLDFLKLQTQTKLLENDLELSRVAFVSSTFALESTIKGTN